MLWQSFFLPRSLFLGSALKCKGLVFFDPDYEVKCTIQSNLECVRGKRDGWAVLVAPSEHIGNGADDDLIKSFVANDVLCEMTADAKQPACLNVRFCQEWGGRSRLIKTVCVVCNLSWLLSRSKVV